MLEKGEEKAFDIFFKAFGRSLTAAQMYFVEHPSYERSISELKDKLVEVGYFRTDSFDVTVLENEIQIDKEIFMPTNERYIQFARKLHKYKIANIKFCINISTQDLKIFVFSLSRYENLCNEGKTFTDIFSGLKGVDVKELDYSILLSLKGEHPDDIWDVLLNFDSQRELTNVSENYIVNNAQKIFSDVMSLPEDDRITESILKSFEKLEKNIEDLPVEGQEEFSRALSTYVLSLGKVNQSMYLKEDSFKGIKKVLKKNISKEDLLRKIVSQISKTKSVNPLLLNLYNTMLNVEVEEEDLADEIADFIDKAKEDEKAEVAEVVQELFLKDESDKFVSRIYNKTLSVMSTQRVAKQKISCQEYQSKFTEEVIEEDYFYTLLEMLYLVDSVDLLEEILIKIQREIPFFVERGNFLILYDMIRAFDKKYQISRADKLGIILEVSVERLRIEEIVKTLLIPNFAELEESCQAELLISYVNNVAESLISIYFNDDKPNKQKRFNAFLTVIDSEELFAALETFLEKNKDGFVLSKAIELLGTMNSVGSAKLLEKIYFENKDNLFTVMQVVEALRINEHKNAELFVEFLSSKNYKLRKATIALCVDGSNSEYRETIVKLLLDVSNFFGCNDVFLIENIELLAELKVLEMKEILLRITKNSPWFFKKKREELKKVAKIALEGLE